MNERRFINMDFDGTKWWVDYHDEEDKRDYFDTKEEALAFYHTFPAGTPPQ
jgi:hypothetical protein